MKRGEVYWIQLHPRSGSEQSGRRPAIIISNDAFQENPKWRSIIVIPLSTSENQMKRGPTAVFLKKGSANLTESSVALCHQITTIDRSKVTARIGTLSSLQLKEIEQGILAALGYI
jgi:mRNA interferase MazF